MQPFRRMSQSLRFVSEEPDERKSPYGWKSMQRIPDLWPVRVLTSLAASWKCRIKNVFFCMEDQFWLLSSPNRKIWAVCWIFLSTLDTRGQFHQRSTHSFYVRKLCVQLFCAYVLGLYFTGVSLPEQKLRVERWWNWTLVRCQFVIRVILDNNPTKKIKKLPDPRFWGHLMPIQHRPALRCGQIGRTPPELCGRTNSEKEKKKISGKIILLVWWWFNFNRK